MIKIAGTIPVKTRIPRSAWLLAALMTIFSLVSPIMHVGARSGPAVRLSQHELQTGQKSLGGQRSLSPLAPCRRADIAGLDPALEHLVGY
jgi:hypothetical protein